MSERVIKLIVGLLLLILAIIFLGEILVFLGEMITAIITSVFLGIVLLVVVALVLLAIIFLGLSIGSLRDKIYGSGLARFESVIGEVSRSKQKLINGQQVHWIRNLQFCEFNNFQSLSLVCTVNEQLKRANSIHECEDNLIVLGIAYFNPKDDYINPRGINAFLPDKKNENLFYTATLEFRNREPWNLSHFLNPQHFRNTKNAIRYIEERATLDKYWLRRTPTKTELIQVLSLTSYAKELDGKLAGFEWNYLALSLYSDCLALQKFIFVDEEDHHYYYAIIYKENNELFMVLPKEKRTVEIDNDIWDGDLSNLIEILNGHRTAITLDRLSLVMEDTENNISQDKVWIRVQED